MTAHGCSVVIFKGGVHKIINQNSLPPKVARPFKKNFVFEMTANKYSMIIFEGGDFHKNFNLKQFAHDVAKSSRRNFHVKMTARECSEPF